MSEEYNPLLPPKPLSTVVSSIPSAPLPTEQKASSAHELQRLNQTHHAMIECCLVGMTRTQIAEAFERSEVGVGLILQSPLFQQELARRRKTHQQTNDQANASVLAQAKDIIERNATKAANTVVSLLDSQDESVRGKHAENLLDRVFGTKQVAASNTFNGPVMMLDGDALANLRTALAEDGRRATRSHSPGEGAIEPTLSPPILQSSQTLDTARSEAGGSVEGVRESDRGEAA